jgi:hypothetical protein
MTAPPTPDEMRPVAWRYRWKLDGEWTSWRVSDHSQKSRRLKDLEEQPLYDAAALSAATARYRALAHEPTDEVTAAVLEDVSALVLKSEGGKMNVTASNLAFIYRKFAAAILAQTTPNGDSNV